MESMAERKRAGNIKTYDGLNPTRAKTGPRGSCLILIERVIVHCREADRDTNVVRADLCAIITGCTRDQPFFFLFPDKAPHIKVIKDLCPFLPQIVQQIEIKIACAGPLKGSFKLRMLYQNM